MLKRSVPFALLASVLSFSMAAHAEESEVCADIESAIERLDCYDRQHRARQARVDQSGPPAPEARTEAAARPARATYQSRRVEPEATQTAPVTVSAPAKERASVPAPAKDEKRGLFSWLGDKTEISSELTVVRRGEQQRMVFRLANGQIWMQNTPRELPFSVGDQVTIKSGTIGGFIMRSERGTSTRVRQLE